VARPTTAAVRDRAAEEAENLIRDSLVQLTAAAIKSALLPADVTCQHCKKKTIVEGTSADPALILKLLERVAGKATEKRDTGVTGNLERLLEQLSTSPSEATYAAEAAEAAKAKARLRATLAAALKEAAVPP